MNPARLREALGLIGYSMRHIDTAFAQLAHGVESCHHGYFSMLDDNLCLFGDCSTLMPGERIALPVPVPGPMQVVVFHPNGPYSKYEQKNINDFCKIANMTEWVAVAKKAPAQRGVIDELIASAKPYVRQPDPAPERKHSHYFRDVSEFSEIDVYRVCDLFGVDDPSGAVHHAIKKLLLAGGRGAGKDYRKDLSEAVDTLKRKLEMMDENDGR